MAAKPAAGPVQTPSTTNTISLETAAIGHAVSLIDQVCCFAGSFELLDEFRDRDLCGAIERHDSAALFDRLMHDFSFQGISDEIAANYMRRYGQATWRPSPRSDSRSQPPAARPWLTTARSAGHAGDVGS